MVENENVQVDIRMFLIMALGNKKYIHPLIDEIYGANKLEYYRAYKDSPFCDCPLFSMYPTTTLEYIKKVAGIVQCDYQNGTLDTIFKLIKKGYKSAYNFSANKNFLDIAEFVLWYVKKCGGIDNATEQEILDNAVVLMYVCIKNKIKYVISPPFKASMDEYFVGSINSCNIGNINFSKEAIEQNRQQIDTLYLKYKVRKKPQTMDVLCNEIVNNETIAISMLTKNKDYHELRNMAFEQGVSKYLGAYSGFLKWMGISEMALSQDIFLSKDDIDKIFQQYLVAKETNNIAEEQRDMFIVSIIFMYALSKEYKKTKDKYLNEMQNDFYYELSKMKEDIDSREAQLRVKSEEIELQKKKMNEETNRLNEEIKKLQKDKSLLEKELEDNEYNKKELLSLREHVYNMEQESSNVNDIEVDEMQKMFEFLKNKNIAVLGGSTIWLNKLKDILPNFVYLDTDSLNRDMKFIDNMDAVFVHTAVMSHSFYNRIMSRMANNNVPLFYTNSKTNLRLTVKHIYESIKLMSE